MYELNHKHEILIEDLPLQWLTRIELFTPDLEQFPLMYVHTLADRVDANEAVGLYNPEGKQRIFGFVISANWTSVKPNGLHDVELTFLCNIEQGYSIVYDALIKAEVEHRVGAANKVSFADLSEICRSAPEVLSVLQSLWRDRIDVVYGDYLPHGRLFEEMYGIVRFSASGNAPKLGKTSEYRMLYWYLKELGEPVAFAGNAEQYDFFEFWLLPTYEEHVVENHIFFRNFLAFYKSTKKLWEKEYDGVFTVGGNNFRFAKKRASLPSKLTNFEKRYKKAFPSDFDNLNKLCQIFNRMPGRLYGYIWNIMTPVTSDYYDVFGLRDNFKEFYRDYGGKKGSSSKVIACFLQQSFGLEAFPIDTWVKTFICFVLGFSVKDSGSGNLPKHFQNDLYDRFHYLDKLEKLVWACSMANKTNKSEFTDVLWCQRYGTDKGGKGPCRGVNPLSCAQCEIREDCAGYDLIRDCSVCVSPSQVTINKKIREEKVEFGVLTAGQTPRKVFVGKKKKGRTMLVAEVSDEHSSLSLSTSIKVKAAKYRVSEFVNLL